MNWIIWHVSAHTLNRLPLFFVSAHFNIYSNTHKPHKKSVFLLSFRFIYIMWKEDTTSTTTIEYTSTPASTLISTIMIDSQRLNTNWTQKSAFDRMFRCANIMWPTEFEEGRRNLGFEGIVHFKKLAAMAMNAICLSIFIVRPCHHQIHFFHLSNSIYRITRSQRWIKNAR